MKTLYLDLVRGGLDNIVETNVRLSNMTIGTEGERKAKIDEMHGVKQKFRYVQFEENHDESASVFAADTIATMCKGMEYHRFGDIRIVHIKDKGITYDGRGIIIEENGEGTLGHNALHYLAAQLHQDIAVVIKDREELRYVFDCSMYEKTPKDVDTGENMFIGRDLLEFHSKAKTYGHILPGIIQALATGLESGELDGLVIDLLGQNAYSNGAIQIRRFERDNVIAIKEDGEMKGLLAYADVYFQLPGQRSPLDGGLYIPFSSPKTFHRNFQVVKKVMTNG